MISDDSTQDVEQILDHALRQYGQAEPRPGLEARVMARLAQEEKPFRRILPWWAFAATAAAVLALALVWLATPKAKQVPENARITTKPRIQAGQSASSASESRVQAIPIRRRPSASSRRTAEAGAPKRERFPSPSPLTEQEQMLAHYVRDFPDRAILTARSQTDLYKQEELEMAAPAKNLDQPE